MIQEKVLIPFLKAAITGVLVALFAASWFIPSVPWKLFAAILSGVCLASWLLVILPNKKIVQRVAQSKIYPTETTRIQITATDPSGQFQAGRWTELKVTTSLLSVVAKRIAAGSSFSHAGLAGPGRPLSRSEFECLRDEFISRGLAYWVNPKSHAQGVRLTKGGEAVMRHFVGCNSTVTPLPQLSKPNSTVRVAPKPAQAHRRTRREALLRD